MDLFGYALNFTMELSSALVEAKSQDSEANSLKMLLKKHTEGTYKDDKVRIIHVKTTDIEKFEFIIILGIKIYE